MLRETSKWNPWVFAIYLHSTWYTNTRHTLIYYIWGQIHSPTRRVSNYNSSVNKNKFKVMAETWAMTTNLVVVCTWPIKVQMTHEYMNGIIVERGNSHHWKAIPLQTHNLLDLHGFKVAITLQTHTLVDLHRFKVAITLETHNLLDLPGFKVVPCIS